MEARLGESDMLLNEFERKLTNSPLRRFLQRQLEIPWFIRHGSDLHGAYVLELGCGQGAGIDLVFEHFGIKQLDAFDLDPQMVEMARSRQGHRGDSVRIWQGDATAIASPENRYDAVFDFEIIHHVPDWRQALAEVYRVLKPGGRFYAGEILKHSLLNPLAARLFQHPMEDRFGHVDFCEALSVTGFRLEAAQGLGDFVGWYVAAKPVEKQRRH